jgi:AcrR family transcriptional regulator
MSEPALLTAAYEVFSKQGFAATTLDHIAARARCGVDELTAQYRDKAGLLSAALKANPPIADLQAALTDLQGDSAEDLMRHAARAMLAAVQRHLPYFELAALDMQINNSAILNGLIPSLLPQTMQFLERLQATGQLRPVPSPVLARTFIALLMGFVLSERAMPQMMQLMMRVFPQKAWLDSMVDLLLYGVLEDDQR